MSIQYYRQIGKTFISGAFTATNAARDTGTGGSHSACQALISRLILPDTNPKYQLTT